MATWTRRLVLEDGGAGIRGTGTSYGHWKMVPWVKLSWGRRSGTDSFYHDPVHVSLGIRCASSMAKPVRQLLSHNQQSARRRPLELSMEMFQSHYTKMVNDREAGPPLTVYEKLENLIRVCAPRSEWLTAHLRHKVTRLSMLVGIGMTTRLSNYDSRQFLEAVHRSHRAEELDPGW
jgi:hypothetical protein